LFSGKFPESFRQNLGLDQETAGMTTAVTPGHEFYEGYQEKIVISGDAEDRPGAKKHGGQRY
jgi:hypothetical protein